MGVLHQRFGETFCLHLQQAFRSLRWDVLPKLFTPFKCCRFWGFHSSIAEYEPVFTNVSKDYSTVIFRVLWDYLTYNMKTLWYFAISRTTGLLRHRKKKPTIAHSDRWQSSLNVMSLPATVSTDGHRVDYLSIRSPCWNSLSILCMFS